jgi:hypothetical protein
MVVVCVFVSVHVSFKIVCNAAQAPVTVQLQAARLDSPLNKGVSFRAEGTVACGLCLYFFAFVHLWPTPAHTQLRFLFLLCFQAPVLGQQ